MFIKLKKEKIIDKKSDASNNVTMHLQHTTPNYDFFFNLKIYVEAENKYSY